MHHESEWGPRPERECGDEVHILGKKVEPVWPFLDGLYLEYHPHVVWYGRGDISSTFASTYKIATPLPTPFTINYLFEAHAHIYLPDAIGQLQGGALLIAEAGMAQDKRRERNQAKAEAARKVADELGGGLLDWNRRHLTPATPCQSRLFTCPPPALSGFSSVGRGVTGGVALR
jgi:hypothetical protein